MTLFKVFSFVESSADAGPFGSSDLHLEVPYSFQNSIV